MQQSEHSITPIKTALTQVENEVAARDRSLANLQGKYDDLKSQAPKEQAEIAKLSAKIGESDTAVAQLNRALNDKDGELTRLGNELNQEKAALRQTDLALNDAQGKRSALEGRMAEMKTRREINNLQMQLNDARHQKDAEVAQLANNLKMENQELQKTKDALKTADQNSEDAAKRIEDLREKLNKNEIANQLALKDQEALKREINSLQNQQTQLQSSYDATAAKLENALSERLRLTEEKTDAQSNNSAAIAKLEGEIARLRAEIAKGDKQQKALSKDKRTATEKLEDHARAAADADKERQSLERKLAMVQAQLDSLQKESAKSAADLKQKLAASDKAKQASDASHSKLEQSIDKLKEELNNKITDAKIASNQRDMLEADIALLEEEVRALDADARALRKELQRSNEKHQDTIAELRQKLAEKEANSSDGGAARKQLADLQKMHKALERDHLSALKKADQRITDLTRAVDRGDTNLKTAEQSDKQSKRRITELDKLLAAALADKKALGSELKKTETEAERMRTDKQLSQAEKKALEKEAAELASANSDLEQQLEEYALTEQNNLGRIHDLELQIVMVRKETGKELMLRIKELESMLAAERRRANDMQQPISVVESIGVTSKITSKKAANSTIKRKKKKAG